MGDAGSDKLIKSFYGGPRLGTAVTYHDKEKNQHGNKNYDHSFSHYYIMALLYIRMLYSNQVNHRFGSV